MFFRISRLCMTFFRRSDFPNVNFSSTSLMLATLVVWWSPRRMLLFLVLLYFLNKLRSLQIWRDTLVYSHQASHPLITFIYVIIVTKSSFIKFACTIGWFVFLKFLAKCPDLLQLKHTICTVLLDWVFENSFGCWDFWSWTFILSPFVFMSGFRTTMSFLILGVRDHLLLLVMLTYLLLNS